MSPSHRSLALLAPVLAISFLACCDQNQKAAQGQSELPAPLALTTAEAGPVAPGPAAAALPRGQAAPMAYLADTSQQYAYVDRAYEVADVLRDTPPDYGFDYGPTRPWAWRGEGFVRVVEPTPGGERYYYYDAGSSSPYLVRDGDYSYAYSGGALVAVYGPDGRVLARDGVRARIDLAGGYLSRARDLYNAALAGQKRAVALDAWRRRRDAIDAERARWAREQAQHQDWRTYHDAHRAENDAYWRGERDRRQAEAQGYQRALNLPNGQASQAAALIAAASAYQAARRPAPRPAPPLPPAQPPAAELSAHRPASPTNPDHGHERPPAAQEPARPQGPPAVRAPTPAPNPPARTHRQDRPAQPQAPPPAPAQVAQPRQPGPRSSADHPPEGPRPPPHAPHASEPTVAPPAPPPSPAHVERPTPPAPPKADAPPRPEPARPSKPAASQTPKHAAVKPTPDEKGKGIHKGKSKHEAAKTPG